MKVLLIVTGSIACYKSLDLIRLLVKSGLEVDVILTRTACKFISPMLVSSLLGREVHTDDSWKIEHISLAKADAILIAPCTANTISHIANGLGGNLALDALLARPQDVPVVIAPAMNTHMLNNPFVHDNISKLKGRNYYFIDTQIDVLACGDYGDGKMANIEHIASTLFHVLNQKRIIDNSRLNIIVSGGATKEPLDDVRFISNYSSGLQAQLIALELNTIANVWYIGNCQHDLSILGDKYIKEDTASEMLNSIQNILANNTVNCFVSVCAVCDFKPVTKSNGKIHKTNSGLTVKMDLNVDILQTISLSKNRPTMCIGFSAQSWNGDEIDEIAMNKIKNKQLDALVVNDTTGGKVFGSYGTKAGLFDKSGALISKSGTKQEVAQSILKLINDTIL